MHIARVEIENIKGFRNLALDLRRADGGLAGWTVLAGRNGSGKTTLLRAMALAIAGPRNAGRLSNMAGWMRVGAEEMKVGIAVTSDGRQDMVLAHAPPVRAGSTRGPTLVTVTAAMSWRLSEAVLTARPSKGEPVLTESQKGEDDEGLRTFWTANGGGGGRGWFACGYGATRRIARGDQNGDEADPYSRVAALTSLFQDDSALDGVVGRLKRILLRSLDPNLESWRQKQAAALLDFICKLLDKELLPDGMVVERVDSRGLWVKQGDTSLLLDDLSDGYRIVTALVVDLVLRLSLDGYGFPAGQFKGDPLPTELSGVVFIDEADLHLHVSWQQKLGFWLKEHFPNIQFIVTTHSPFICQAADLIIRLPPPNSDEAAGPVSDDVYRAVVNGSADDAVMSELFGLESSRSRQAEERLTELARLERLVRKNQATPAQIARYQELDADMPASADVDRAIRGLERGAR